MWREIKNIDDKTTQLLRFLLPSIKTITRIPKVNYDINAVKCKVGIVYSAMGTGKTELMRSIVEQAVIKYGLDNVNARSCSSIGDLVYNSLDNRLVQILIADDITLSKTKPEVITDFFKIRHLWKQQSKRPFGYILCMLGSHRFHGVQPPELRTSLDYIIFKSSCTSPFDRHIVKLYLGAEGFKTLRKIEKYREKDLNLMSYSMFWARERIGLANIPMAKENYVKSTIESKIYDIPNKITSNKLGNRIGQSIFKNSRRR